MSRLFINHQRPHRSAKRTPNVNLLVRAFQVFPPRRVQPGKSVVSKPSTRCLSLSFAPPYPLSAFQNPVLGSTWAALHPASPAALQTRSVAATSASTPATLPLPPLAAALPSLQEQHPGTTTRVSSCLRDHGEPLRASFLNKRCSFRFLLHMVAVMVLLVALAMERTCLAFIQALDAFSMCMAR
jgi:hypothetical protein